MLKLAESKLMSILIYNLMFDSSEVCSFLSELNLKLDFTSAKLES